MGVQLTLWLAYSELRSSVYEPYSLHSELQSISIQALGSDVVCFVVGLDSQGYETTVKTRQFPESGESHLWRLRLKTPRRSTHGSNSSEEDISRSFPRH
jgi:hypothetical protein